VIHAFKDRGGQGSIIVRAELDGDTLSLSVSDDGCGMDARTVGELLGSARDEDGPAKVMGLENVIHRLRFFFPDDPDVVSIKSSPGEGTSVLIRLNVEKTHVFSADRRRRGARPRTASAYIIGARGRGIFPRGKGALRLRGDAPYGREAADVVFMDISMPGIDGFETIARVHDRFPRYGVHHLDGVRAVRLAQRAIPLGV
jgi:CheY-like chemotaxis protein